MTILDAAPATITQGDSAAWRVTLAAYLPADGWVLHQRLLWRTPPQRDLVATPDGGAHLVSAPSAETLLWQVGEARLASWVERAGERVALGLAVLTVAPNYAAASSLDDRSGAQRGLDDAQAALAAALAGGMGAVAEYEVAGRRVQFRSLDQLREMVAHYQREVVREAALAAAAQGVAPGRVYTRF